MGRLIDEPRKIERQ